jgi:hypothetical protein
MELKDTAWQKLCDVDNVQIQFYCDDSFYAIIADYQYEWKVLMIRMLN